ncbi:MAG: MraY family glycosyltransferase [Luteimonas sp.]
MPGASAGGLGVCLACFAIGLSGTWLARRYALRRQLVDLPGERRSHTVPTPRGGGIAIVVAMLVALAWALATDAAHPRFLAAAGAGLVLIAGIGWIDDHRPLPPWPRLVVQGIAAAALAWGLAVEGGSLAGSLIGFIAAMVLVNVWNFMDGIDGIATTQAILAGLAYAVFASDGPAAWLALGLVAGSLGFLPFNFPRARIFLGDVGSGALGYALAASAAWIARDDWLQAPLLLLPLSAFLADASLTLAARALAGQRWWLPHAEHAYQFWARRLRSHQAVAFSYAGWTLLAVFIMFGARNRAGAFIMPIVTAVFVVACAVWIWSRWLRRREEAAGR